MGYHVSILRTAAGSQQPITVEDLRKHAANNDQWELDFSGPRPSYSLVGKYPITCWLDDGELWTKNPDEHGLRSLIALANDLRARVRGDEFETYREDLSTYSHPDDFAEQEAAVQSGEKIVQKARRRHWIVSLMIVSFLVLLTLVATRCSDFSGREAII